MSDIQVDGPGSPTSLQKFIDSGAELRKLTVLVDGTGLGIAQDAPDYLYITPAERTKQCRYYVDEVWDGNAIPTYLFRHMHWFFTEFARGEVKYPTDQSVVDSGLTTTSDDYILVKNLIKYSAGNAEAEQLIGMIQLVCGSLSAAKKAKSGIKLYIQYPEACLHPARQSAFMSWMIRVEKEYEIVTEATIFRDEAKGTIKDMENLGNEMDNLTKQTK